ncbi:hypothetical protein [Halalkalibacter alkaliphilus]|uniref:Uncharacterized protein n=1 Tax=Halalkalibacter alkaliphilus TaxID=2917993 RepID=A0A9X2CRU4_9BACI|nr:hypothetical protein [Halalkalibacter alkaliphilus]MCL7747033.1 hypothetical protein [Halalkalibacter alkaliphilus]
MNKITGSVVMGFFVEIQNSEGHALGGVSYGVWNPNIKFLYEALGLENPYGEWSGNKEVIAFSHQDIMRAYKKVKNVDFFKQPEVSKLDPIVRLFETAFPNQIDVEEERVKLLRFFKTCIKVAKEEGKISLYFG